MVDKVKGENQETKEAPLTSDQGITSSETPKEKVLLTAEQIAGMNKEGQSSSDPPKVDEGKKACWHKPFAYTNSKGSQVVVKGHWEVIDKPKPKV